MDTQSVRIIFIGSSSFFTRAPLFAVANRCALAGVIDSPRPDSRQRQHNGLAGPSVMRHFARRRGIPYLAASACTAEVLEFVDHLHADLICVASSRLLLSKDVLALPRWGAINLHPSALPAYRGPNPFFWQYHDMDLRGGVTIHRVDEGIDTGDILQQERFDIPLGAPFIQTFQTALRKGTAAMIRAIRQLAAGQPAACPQMSLLCPRYARFVRPDEAFIDWQTWPVERIWHFLRGTHDEHPTLPARPGESWRIGELVRTPSSQRAGTISHDDTGDYLAHREGKIRLHRAHEYFPGLLSRARRLRRILEWW